MQFTLLNALCGWHWNWESMSHSVESQDEIQCRQFSVFKNMAQYLHTLQDRTWSTLIYENGEKWVYSHAVSKMFT